VRARRPLKSYQYYYSSGMNESNLRRRLGLETKFAAPRSDSKQRRAYQYLTAFCVYFHMCESLQGLNSLLAPSSLFLSLSISFVQAAESIFAPRTHFHNVSASYYTALFLGGGMRNLARGSRRAIPLLREQPREPTMRSALREATSSAVMPKS
jgi:hypothetical protein